MKTCKAIVEMKREARLTGMVLGLIDSWEKFMIDDSLKNVSEKDKKDAAHNALNELRKEAREKEREDIIKTMSGNGFDINTIAKALNLDNKYIKKVLTE